MSVFREDLVSDMDETILDTLADDAEIDGRPVRGMFAAPWLAPQIGHLKTSIVEPQFALLDHDAAGVVKGSVVVFASLTYEVMTIEPDGTGWTTLVMRPTS